MKTMTAGISAHGLRRLIPASTLPNNTASALPYNEDQRVRLSDGRSLGFATYGEPNGWPVLYCHGNPTSRIEARFFDAAAREHGCRLIAPDRPGYGLSDPHPGRTLLHWFDDVSEFIDSKALSNDFDFSQFSIACFSSGAAYALLCASNLSATRLKSIAIVSGVAPLERICGSGGYSALAFRLALRSPRVARSLFNLNTRQMHRRPDKVLRRASHFFSKSDARIFFEPRTARILIDSYLQAVRCGPQAVIEDMSLLAKPWGFDLGRIVHRVGLWYGACDVTVPPASMGRYLERTLPNAEMTIVPGEGHLSMLDSMGSAVFRQLKNDID